MGRDSGLKPASAYPRALTGRRRAAGSSPFLSPTPLRTSSRRSRRSSTSRNTCCRGRRSLDAGSDDEPVVEHIKGEEGLEQRAAEDERELRARTSRDEAREDERDVDLDGANLQVTATLHSIPGGGFAIADPKTDFSRRRIALSKLAVQGLRAHRERQVAERSRAGASWEELDLVFPNTVGRPLDGLNLLKYRFYPLLKKAGLRKMRFHDLRHTAATLLLGRGINPKVVSEMLGHSHISVTLGIYSHVTPHMQQQAASAMDAALGLD
jgi:hypothetical protein